MTKMSACEFLEARVLDEWHKLPADFIAAPEEIIIDRLLDKKHVFVGFMQIEPTWFGLIAEEPGLDANAVCECYNTPLGFQKFCNEWLWKYFCHVTSFEKEVIAILVRNGHIEADDDEPNP